MYLPTVIVLLFAAQIKSESNNVELVYDTCYGGVCLPKHLCPTGQMDGISTSGHNDLVNIQIGEENECEDFMMICCKKAIRNLDKNAECGISNPGGLVYNIQSDLKYANYAEFPWTVAIFQKTSTWNDDELTHVGGGTLIHPKFVVTAAHTLKDGFRYVARFGEWNMNSEAEAYPTQDIDIEKHIIHPSYRRKTTDYDYLENDLALAVLEKEINYSEYIRPLCLPRTQDVFDSQRCIATGWGLDVRTGEPATILKRMELNVLSRASCQMINRDLDLPFPLHRSVMCAEEAEDQNVCVKDGGSPLACQKDDGSYVLAGVASWRLDNGEFDSPGFFVNVTKFVCWIHDTIEEYEERRAEEESDENKTQEMKAVPLLLKYFN